MTKFHFPNIKKIDIENFSLYKKVDEISINIDKDVFCLVGANGLGKSTFITIINYALTGIVKNPERNFSWYKSISGFYTKSKSFAESYFDGRIAEKDYELAQVTIEFDLGDKEYKITRGFFEPDEIRLFERKVKGENTIYLDDDTNSSDLDEQYKTHFIKDSGFSEFAQFVFLQSYVLTFDETHQLLFWDSDIMERVLYLFFGLDSTIAKKADKLRKDYNAYDSNFRNLQWQITQTNRDLKNILNANSSKPLAEEDIKIAEKHKELLENITLLQEELHQVAKEIQECDLNIADLSIKISSLRSEYNEAFNNSMAEETPVEKDEELLRLIKEIKSRIFSDEPVQELIEKLVDYLKEQKRKNNSIDPRKSFEDLTVIDKKLSVEIEKQEEFQNRKNRFSVKDEELYIKVQALNNEIKKIESENENIFNFPNNTDESIELIKKSFQDTIDRLKEQKEESRVKREAIKEELGKLENEMSKSFLEAEETFIPKFNFFANSFLGLEINIELSSNTKGANLILRVDDNKRSDAFQLSESQRYFIDIALRMALLGIGTEKANLLIDTPEGSLDIAYESRAGKMIADFSDGNFSTVMTANINSSQLLLELAKICGRDRMHIERMTNWTYLSEVQNDANEKIETAFNEIERRLDNE
ncbi:MULTISPECIES: AAA family ATPase [Bacteroidota]|uniref:Rad50/SbcC-type AAA domain-containing protein n=1 Tax=Elizabethkingia anophelis TaxID=1117645 RepID=A0A494J9P1_9FLAO|nr:AAA family ATPase [Elizabethkingia anophelis]AQX51629.1 hypothetical protein AYC66_13520 [Elizabethkingia anophelis]MCT4196354.1 AAA family ATPase [Elizabethkingia anophelis]MCT4225701.1 AAA family ATPase [Elizabethkingia anophelis]MCT4307292.1 AAA family ATPase [Elizabethkingia anophelis]OPB52354.1 hypothetical protein BAY09_14465 [Elizabethkingia anophelis]